MAADPRGLPSVVRWYLRAGREWGRVQRLGDAVLVGTFLGLMDERSLTALDVAAYDTVTEDVSTGSVRYNDAEHIRSGLTDWEREALTGYVPPQGRIIVTSAGAGREVRGALELGYAAIGYEPHEGLQAAGDALLSGEGHAGVLHRCARDAFPAEAPRADAVLVGWGSYSHIAPRHRRVAFLRDARARLDPGGPLIVSFWMLPERERQLDVVFRTATVLRRLRRLAPPERGDMLLPHFGHAFGARELRGELAEASFDLVELRHEPYPHAVAVAT